MGFRWFTFLTVQSFFLSHVFVFLFSGPFSDSLFSTSMATTLRTVENKNWCCKTRIEHPPRTHLFDATKNMCCKSDFILSLAVKKEEPILQTAEWQLAKFSDLFAGAMRYFDTFEAARNHQAIPRLYLLSVCHGSSGRK